MSSQRPAFTWTCPSCKRKVPSRVNECHCGFSRSQAAAAERASVARPAAGPRRAKVKGQGWIAHLRSVGLRWDFWASMAVLALAVLIGVWQLFRPHPRGDIVPVLGFVDPPRPSAPATPPASKPVPRR